MREPSREIKRQAVFNPSLEAAVPDPVDRQRIEELIAFAMRMPEEGLNTGRGDMLPVYKWDFISQGTIPPLTLLYRFTDKIVILSKVYVREVED